MTSTKTLYNFGFISLTAFVLFAFCNLAVFFSFYSYLATLPIPTYWHGLLIGLLSVSALIIRPFISTILTPYNAIKGIVIGLILTIISLLLYSQAQSLLLMVLLRILHGMAFVTLMSSSITLLMVFMPINKSGQGFGIVTIATLLPYAVIPYILEKFFNNTPLGTVYALMALMILPAGFILIPLTRYLKKHQTKDTHSNQRLPRGSLWINVRQKKILALLLANGLLFATFSLIFFFLKTFCDESGIGNPGLFFTISTGTMVAIRIFFGTLFDKFNKAILIIASLLTLVTGLTLLVFAESGSTFYGAALLYGVGVGAATPLMNGLMFTISQPVYRGLNANLMMEMVDVGFFLGPTLCGIALSTGFSQSTIISVSIGSIILAATLMIPLIPTPNTVKQ